MECCHLNDEFNLAKSNDDIVDLLMKKGNEMHFRSVTYNDHISNENNSIGDANENGNSNFNITPQMAKEQQKIIECISKRYIKLGKFLQRKLHVSIMMMINDFFFICLA